VVHGDYDVDGVCSTAVLVRSLRALGADVGWFLPSRMDDGYGLSPATVRRLAGAGTALLVTVDCAITAVEEVAAARAAGMVLGGTAKPGVRALMHVAQVDPGALDAHALGFRLAPRINAAGRLRRADAGLELVLTDDEARAAAVAAELDAANAERRHVETRILFAAEAQVAEAGDRSAYVLAGEDWHPGVIGIVA